MSGPRPGRVPVAATDDTGETPAPRSSRGFDPVGAAVSALALVVYCMHGFHGYLTRDLGLYAYAGQQFADGVPPYESLLSRSGPLAYLIPGLGAVLGRWVGVDDVVAMRGLYLLLAVACVWVSYLLCRDLFGSRAAGVAAAMTLISISGFIAYASNGPREKTAMVLFLTLTLWALTHRRWFATGVFVALATLTWQPVFIVAITATLAGILTLGSGHRARALLSVAIGGALPTAVLVAYFAVVGALDDFLLGFVEIHLRYTHQPGFDDSASQMWEATREGFGPSLWVLLAGTVALLLLGFGTLVRAERRARDPGRMLLAVAIATVAALIWSYRVYNGWGDAFVLIPTAVVGVGALTTLILGRLPRRVGHGVVLGWAVVAAVIAGDYAIETRNTRLTEQRDLNAEVLRIAGPQADVWSIEAPQPLVFSGRRNPTEHQMFLAGLQEYLDATWPGGLHGFAGYVERERPTLISVSRQPHPPWWIRDLLTREYHAVGRAPGYAWYADRELPAQKREALRAALAGR